MIENFNAEIKEGGPIKRKSPEVLDPGG